MLSIIEEIEIWTVIKLRQQGVLQQVAVAKLGIFAAYLEMEQDTGMRQQGSKHLF